MANVLEKIVADKRVEIEARKLSKPLSQFEDQLTPSKVSFYDALSGDNAGFIFECKKASPSKGLIREHFDLDEIIDAYAPYASAISVLTDEKYFQGKFEYLSYVKKRVQQPVLNKDFFIDAYQVHLARYYDADAILLMLSVLSDDEYKQLARLASHYRLDILTEVSNEEECHRAVDLGARIIGINNRNLRDLSTDLATTETLVPLLKSLGHTGLVISESGIYTHQDVLRLSPLSDGFLVGSSMMAEDNLKGAVEKLLFSEVKVCGITNVDDARTVADSPANYAGLIFAEKSKRYVSLATASEIVNTVPQQYTGVFVNSSVDDVAQTAKALNLAAVQLHGDEDQEYIDLLRRQLPSDCEIWQVYAITDSIPPLEETNVDRFLLDCKSGNESGGTGKQFDWSLLSDISDKTAVVLAGGLTPDNLKEALATGVCTLDLNSGVESAPGVKDSNKIQQAFSVLRTY